VQIGLCICLNGSNMRINKRPVYNIKGPNTSLFVQGGEDSWNPLVCRSFSTKEPLNIGHFCGK